MTNIPTDETFEETWAREERERVAAARADFVAGLHTLASFLAEHPNAPLPYSIYAGTYVETLEEVRAITHGTGSWSKSYNDYAVEYLKKFTDAKYGGVRYVVSLERTKACRKVVTGTKHIPEEIVPEKVIPARDEEIIEWICDDSPE
jgi:hypothetical protein